MNKSLLPKLKQVFALVYLLAILLFGNAFKAFSQTNIAPLAVVDAFGAAQPGWNWQNINNVSRHIHFYDMFEEYLQLNFLYFFYRVL
jgi:hypothetical protein